MCRYDVHLRLPSGQVHPEIHVNKEEVKTFGLNLPFPNSYAQAVYAIVPTDLELHYERWIWEPVVQPTVA